MARRADEQRQHPRVEARLAMQLAEESLGTSLVTTETLNISRGGIYCESSEFLSPLSRVALTVVLPVFRAGAPQRVLRTEGIVVRSEALAPVGGKKRWQLACCFTSLDNEARSVLDQFISWRAAGGRVTGGRRTAASAAPGAGKKALNKAVRKTVRKVAGNAKRVAKSAKSTVRKAANSTKKTVKKAIKSAKKALRKAAPKPRGRR